MLKFFLNEIFSLVLIKNNTMKRILVISGIIILFCNLSFSQNKPSKNFLGIGIDYKIQKQVQVVDFGTIWPTADPFLYVNRNTINTFPSLKFDYYFNEMFSLNLSYRPIYFNKSQKNQSENSSKYYSETSFSIFTQDIGLGFETHFFKKFKIDPYVGLDLNYVYSSKGKEKSNSKRYFEETNILNAENKITNKGVESNAVYSVVKFGFNYFIIKNFSVGINLNLGYKYGVRKGTSYSTSSYSNYDIDGNIIHYNNNNNESKINNINQGFIYSFSIKSSVYFSLLKRKTEK